MILELALLEAYVTLTDPLSPRLTRYSSMHALLASPVHLLVRFNHTAMPRIHTAAMVVMLRLTTAMEPSMGLRLSPLRRINWPRFRCIARKVRNSRSMQSIIVEPNGLKSNINRMSRGSAALRTPPRKPKLPTSKLHHGHDPQPELSASRPRSRIRTRCIATRKRPSRTRHRQRRERVPPERRPAGIPR